MPLDRASIRAYVERDWGASRDRKRAYWRTRLTRDGLAEALRVTEQLRQWMKQTNPAWPTPKDREEDLETHIRVAQALAKTAPSGRTSPSRAARVRSGRQ